MPRIIDRLRNLYYKYQVLFARALPSRRCAARYKTNARSDTSVDAQIPPPNRFRADRFIC